MMNVNFFSKVVVSEDGSMRFIEKLPSAGAAVELRAEMNTLVILNTCQHPMDPEKTYATAASQINNQEGRRPGPDDICPQLPSRKWSRIHTHRALFSLAPRSSSR